MRVDVVTVFPEYLAPLRLSLLGRAQSAGLLQVRVHDLRDHTDDVHRTVDDSPYGGGPGMLMRPEPWGRALDAVRAAGPVAGAVAPLLLVPSPAGRRLDQPWAAELAREPWLAVACGRYEGLDARVAADAARHGRVAEVSLGDYVLAGGEVAALVLVECVARLLPGVLGNAGSAGDDSFSGGLSGLLEAPAWTRPPVWRGLDVPEVLRSGDHGAVARWRRRAALARTAAVRPDLLTAAVATGDVDASEASSAAADAERLGVGAPGAADDLR